MGIIGDVKDAILGSGSTGAESTISTLLRASAYAVMGANAGIVSGTGPLGGAVIGLMTSTNRNNAFASTASGMATNTTIDALLGVSSLNMVPLQNYIKSKFPFLDKQAILDKIRELQETYDAKLEESLRNQRYLEYLHNLANLTETQQEYLEFEESGGFEEGGAMEIREPITGTTPIIRR